LDFCLSLQDFPSPQEPSAHGVSHGVKERGYWEEDELPSNRHSDVVLKKNYLRYLKCHLVAQHSYCHP
jgi:hypothetical protein